MIVDEIKNDNITLRIVDWFCTNYTKKVPVRIDNNILDVHSLYKIKLKQKGKKNFDPFCRNGSTEAQEQFLEWFKECGAYEYLKENLSDVEEDMKNVLEKRLKDTQLKKEVKRKSLTGRRQVYIEKSGSKMNF